MKSFGMSRAIAALSMLALLGIAPASVHAQTTGEEWGRWWFGIYGGANINLFNGQIHDINASLLDVATTTGFDKGTGFGLGLGGIVEFNSGGLLGGNLMIGYDNRAVGFDNKTDTVRGAQELSASPAYLTIEPNLRVNLGNRFFHFMVGPSFGINIAKGSQYKFTDVNNTQQTVSGDLANVRSLLIGLQAGVGYDIPLAGPDANTQILLTPFAQFRMGQDLLDVPSGSASKFSLNTIRAGVQLKFGSRPKPMITDDGPETIDAGDFTLRAPNVITESRRLNETFPMRNYLFFDAGSTDIPTRYTRISGGEAANFREEQLLKPSVETGRNDAMAIRSRRQMEVYYQVLNVLGDRMKRNPAVSIKLVGSANGNAAQGKEMADNVKNYLVSTFGIDQSRIATEGQPMPANRSGSGSSQGEDAKMIAAENTRVTIVGPNEILRPVNIQSIQEEPVENDVVFTIPTSDDIAFWNVEITPSGGAPQTFGPYRNTNVARIDSKQLIGSAREGRFSSRISKTTKDGQATTTDPKEFRLVRADADEAQTGERYSILFEFDDSKTVQTYEQFLGQTVAPAIPNGASVIIHGHTDVIGDPEYNAKLSQRRAEETQRILTRELTKAGKTVTFDTYGFGEDERRAAFNNTLPEQRYYNRTVVVEVVPGQ
jgi:outer membrane protein OmpA-like peptidoglycan-associated protein